MRRSFIVLGQTAVLFLAALILLLGFRHYSASPSFDLSKFKSPSGNLSTTGEYPHPDKPDADADADTQAEAVGESRPGLGEKPHVKDGNATLFQIAPSYINAIMTPDDQSYPRLDCPSQSGDRYDYLRLNSTYSRESSQQLRYFFALDLHQCVAILPRLLGSIVETMRFLGTQNCALSIVEGRSDDGTFEVLKILREEIERIGGTYIFTTSEIDPLAQNGDNRVKALAELRNLALQPLVDHPERYSPDATVVFINDVALCTEDILELIHQRAFQQADMTCALDWTYVGHDPTFYDVWIARGMNGDSFFEIPEDGNWNSAWNLFWNNPIARDRLHRGEPFQVFSCWNGATSFTAKPLLENKVHFRSAYDQECQQGEPKLFCKDMWYQGYGKIAVVPSVNLEYSDEAARKIKEAKGYVSSWVKNEGDDPLQIEWETLPPSLVKCIPSYSNQTWVPWDEQLPSNHTPP